MVRSAGVGADGPDPNVPRPVVPIAGHANSPGRIGERSRVDDVQVDDGRRLRASPERSLAVRADGEGGHLPAGGDRRPHTGHSLVAAEAGCAGVALVALETLNPRLSLEARHALVPLRPL